MGRYIRASGKPDSTAGELMTLRFEDRRPVGLDWSVCTDGSSNPDLWKRATAARRPVKDETESAPARRVPRNPELIEMGVGVPAEKPKARRGTSNGNVNGNSEDRRRRREWLVETYRADVTVWWRFGTLIPCEPDHPDAQKACRCYRCGHLLSVNTVTVDRIIPGCQGGTYHHNNIRPACSDCNEKTGRALRRKPAKCPRCKGGSRYRRQITAVGEPYRACPDDWHKGKR